GRHVGHVASEPVVLVRVPLLDAGDRRASTMIPVVIAAYLIGSVPFALLLARRWGAADLRRIGSGNLGAANVLRASGVKAGVLVALLDITKGAVSVMLAERFGGNAAAPAAAGFAAIVATSI